MKYIACQFTVVSAKIPVEVAKEILVAELGEIGFESFTETENGVTAFIREDDWNDDILSGLQILESEEVNFSMSREVIEQVNWNEEWEKNFNPIDVAGKVQVRAPFHSSAGLEFDIVIEPKMSFGTGHHETTHLMIQHLLHMDLQGKSVLDMGCGTGILAILAEMKGAKSVDAIDIDPWCYENALENAQRNQCHKISVYEGDVKRIAGKKYDVIIANINRNILLADLPAYVEGLEPDGTLLLSGFYAEDVDQIDACARENGLRMALQLERNHWVGLKYVN